MKNDKFKELLTTILTSDEVSDEIKLQVKEILDEDFKEEVRDKFKMLIWSKDYDDRERGAIKNATKCGFIKLFYGFDTLKNFLDENYDKIDEIINILKEYVDEIEKAEAGENGND